MTRQLVSGAPEVGLRRAAGNPGSDL